MTADLPAGIFAGFDGSTRDGIVMIARVDEDGVVWQELGWTDADGLTRPEYDASEPVRALPDGEDILARIDAVTETATTVDLCACGCRIAVGPGAPSPFFATAGCQRRWHGRQATDVDDVYHRRDAAQVFVGMDGRQVPLQEADGNVYTPPDGSNPTERRWRRLVEAAQDDSHQAAYRRLCPGCQELVVPDVFEDTETITSWGQHPVRMVPTGLRLSCPLCAVDIPGCAFYGTVTENAGQLVLELSDTQSRVRRVLRTHLLARAGNPAGLIRSTWAELEKLLSKFARRFNGRTGRHP